jgi:NurA-like 5'-3' nuclease
MNDTNPKFTKKLANRIAATSVLYVLGSIRSSDVDDRQYDLEESSDRFTDNFVEDLESKGLIVSERRIEIISECFDKQLAEIRSKVEAIYKKLANKYE